LIVERRANRCLKLSMLYSKMVLYKPVEKVELPEHREREITIKDDIPTKLIAVIAERARSFRFLADPREDIYTIHDGESI